ncbi:hypothetical protein SprV_0902706900 [Sparganum proliferum]
MKRSRHWYLVDYVLFRRLDRQDVLITKTIPGASEWTDHRLVISKMRIRLLLRRRPQVSDPQRLRERQNTWAARKAEEIQGYADHNESKNLFSAIKVAYGPPTKGILTLLSADESTLLTEKTKITQRWVQHFKSVLNRPSIISDAAISRLPQVETIADLDLSPSLHEIFWTVQQLYSGKVLGSDAVPTEIYKYGYLQLVEHLSALFQEIWCQREVNRDKTIVYLYRQEGNRQIRDNHRGISQLNIVEKISLASISTVLTTI